MDSIGELELILAAQDGDLEAFEELVRRNQTLVYRVALRMLGNTADAEDATQEALVEAWQALSGFRAESSLATWLYRLVVNRCLNLLRARRSSEPLDEAQEAHGGRPNHAAETASDLEALKRAIITLTPEQRVPLVLRELEGLSYEEIAYVLETTVPAVKGRIHRARLALLHSRRSWR